MPDLTAFLLFLPFSPLLLLPMAFFLVGLIALSTEVQRGEPFGRRFQVETVTSALTLLSLWVATSPLLGGVLAIPLIALIRFSHHLMARRMKSALVS